MKYVFSLFLKSDSLPHADASSFTNLLNILFGIIGALAFLMIVIAGLRYTLGGANSDTVASARRQIIYAGAGLVVIALAATIVNFVVDKV